MAKRLKVYFACSIKGEPGGLEEKELIVSSLKDLGHNVLSEVFISPLQNISGNKKLRDDEIYHRDINWLYDADIMVADVARVSLGVGFEMGWMLGNNKKVVALCKKEKFKNLSSMVKGCRYPGFTIHTWKNNQELQKVLIHELGVVD